MARWWRHILVAVASTAAALPLRVQLDLGHSASLPVLDGAAFAKGGDRSGGDGGGGRGGEAVEAAWRRRPRWDGGKGAGSGKGVPMETAAEKVVMAGRATPEAQAAGTGMPEAARAARLEAIRLEVIGAETMQAQVAQVRATKAESAVTVKAGAKATLAAAAKAADPPEVQAAVPEEAPALGRVPVTAAPEGTPRARAEEATPMATRPQAPVTESQATAGAAKDEAAKGQARLTTHGAGTGVPETAREPAQPKRGPARETVKANGCQQRELERQSWRRRRWPRHGSGQHQC